ncbi:MAG TPA: efflux RND transporter periplasmic adaptor subunit [Verrucomicrobiae bacterium]|nr:efflux RND transporter periplasmic adaptor subunit [Verrucomicrobiae bacterium]
MKLLTTSNLSIFGCFAFVVSCTIACKPESKTTPSPPLVEVATVTRGDVPIYHEWIGTLDGLVNAQIRAQVAGYLLTQDYHEGDGVKKGDLLFEIDPRPYQAALEQAKGALAQADARLGKSELDVKRYGPLVKDKAISQEEYDDAIQANKEAKAAVVSAKAQVDQSQLNLEFTKINSPIDGIPGIARAQIGDLVGPAGGELTTVSTIDPIKAYFNVSEQSYVNFTRLFETESARSEQIKHLEAELLFPDGKAYPLKGKINAIDRSVGLTTGALRVEARFPNPNNALRPGQFARIRVKTETQQNALLVPYRAVSELQGSYQVAIVNADNKIHIQQVHIGERTGNECIVEEGLESGQRVVVEGAQKISEGATVTLSNYVAEPTLQPASAK